MGYKPVAVNSKFDIAEPPLNYALTELCRLIEHPVHRLKCASADSNLPSLMSISIWLEISVVFVTLHNARIEAINMQVSIAQAMH